VVPQDLPHYFENEPWRSKEKQTSVFELRLKGPKAATLAYKSTPHAATVRRVC